jgi:uncharacterized phage-associated protein
MIAYQKEKIENAITFFAARHKKATRKPLSQTFLYKYLAFLDFTSLEETGRPALGLRYKAMERGPVPIGIYSKREDLKTPVFEFRKVGETQFVVMPKQDPNLDYFSRYEIDLMDRLIEIYADVFVRAGDISEASHQEIRAWKKAWDKQPNSIIDYELTFNNGFLFKQEDQLTLAEENYLIYKGIEEPALKGNWMPKF